MSYSPIDPLTIKVGDPITKDLLDKINANFESHETRLNASETTGGSVFIFNGDISFANFNAADPNVFYYKAATDFSISEVRGQIFNKGSITSGSLTLDVQKSTDTNDSGFNTILTSQLTFNFASDANYSEHIASINAGVSAFTAGMVLRVKVTAVPAGFSGKILLSIGAE